MKETRNNYYREVRRFMSKFEKKFTIPYYDCNMGGYVRTTSLLEYLGETSTIHSEFMGMGAKECKEMNCGWILNRWKVRFDSYPKAQEEIIIETWPSKFYKFYANREFMIYDKKRKLIGKASSLWILIDTKRERPIRITDKVYKVDHIIEEFAFDDFHKFDEFVETDMSIDFHVRKSDIDYNNHVNNAKYLDWILEVISRETEENYILNEFEILYKKEVKYGKTVLSQSDEGKSLKNTLEYHHKIIDEDSGELKTFGKTLWKKR